ncbi:MAG: nuclear transport factor 2 family protein [Solirubrobacterales bacterium]|nr:nuclear transport factor 2 family protein [Solirubrobacterales bacterium]MCB8969677.1 nuclear transport factor 2 family protein [Thermoleophilales bacterium]MCO5327952.1 nuclear transport factor 2 family protein [Solirubrobacterales bacterium]
MLHDRFVDAVHALDKEAIKAEMAEDITFWSPVSFKPYQGKQLVGTIITEGPFVIFEEFEYVHRVEDGEQRIATLIFRAEARGKKVEGIDLLHFDDDGLVDELTVMLRPLSGLQAMAEAMGQRFKELGLA